MYSMDHFYRARHLVAASCCNKLPYSIGRLLSSAQGSDDLDPCSLKSWSPYIRAFVEALRETNWDVSIAVPHKQRSWIGKAHILGQNITTTFLYTKGIDGDTMGPFDTMRPELAQDYQEWVLLDGTPATCANIGVNYLYQDKGPVDLVISGPNYGRNTSSAYILSSGTFGAALEAAMAGRRAVALSFSYTIQDHPLEHVKLASELSIKIIKHLLANWNPDVQIYSINVPLSEDLGEKTKVIFTPLLENQWASVYEPQSAGNGRTEFRWAPKYHLCDESAINAGPGTDAWSILHGDISITPLRATYKQVEELYGTELDLTKFCLSDRRGCLAAIIDTSDKYTQDCWTRVFEKHSVPFYHSYEGAPLAGSFDYRDYDDIDFDFRAGNGTLLYSYVYRKALIRKNYLTNTIAYYRAKHPKSILNEAFPDTFNLEVDYAEFLDDALDESYELRQEIEKNTKVWILKPALSDRAHGIRIFQSLEGLQSIFDAFEEFGDEDEDKNTADDGVQISNLRHFVVQEYLRNPLLIDERKFHLRVYVVASGAIKIFVYNQVLALFSSSKYQEPAGNVVDTSGHLTNTCFQDGNVDESTVRLLSQLPIEDGAKNQIFESICSITRDVFDAALNDRINFQPLDNAMEFFGLDFLVDENLGVQILEVNAYPDFQQTGSELNSVVYGLFEASYRCVINPFFSHREFQDERLRLVLDKKIHQL